MWRFAVLLLVGFAAAQQYGPRSGDQLVSSVFSNCVEMGCVKQNVLEYLDNILNLQSDARSIKDVDQAIFKRAARVLKTHEFRVQLPQTFFDGSELVYNPNSGLDITTGPNEERGLGLKKKLLLPILLLFKLKMKALMPIFVGLIGLKAMKALVLSKLAIAIVLGFVAYQLFGKSGMPMPIPMSMTPVEPPMSMYGPPSTSAPMSSYEPGWEPASGGPYSRVWNGGSSSSSSGESSQSLAYSSYYPGTSASSSTVHP
ncbi:PREDICTED: uncharacterized protein LOC108558277 [Nicrophorus vespilloides]|uniref:Uncharacterized protein LOC108558277 n=1 Tax=Nicrophorus vespilloides TaxID=110193 RepID=A0ABM1M7S8_NICVS|nr:PREDICTED: uncharacterized protein LOC108558277 [Nicrophorus vespilloides]